MLVQTIARPKPTPAPQISIPPLITGEALFVMGDIGPCELVKGEIIRHMPTGHPHGFIESNITRILGIFVFEHKLGRIMSGEVGIYTKRDPDTVRGADVIFMSNEGLTQAQPRGFLDVAPELVVEILSPDDRWSKVKEKVAEYFEAGVKLVWVVDPHHESVHAYQSVTEVRLLTTDDILTGEDILPAFQVAVADLFAM